MSKLIEFNGKPLRIDPHDPKWLEVFSGGAWCHYSFHTVGFEDIMNYGSEIMAMGRDGKTYISNSNGRSWVPKY